mmetsp:Transcript_34694/g.68031  ORF Transcript_34694/g.68031 Transcript_34694/m.68031 type:complete len:378 (-) Transcript_34694:283-1416(-)
MPPHHLQGGGGGTPRKLGNKTLETHQVVVEGRGARPHHLLGLVAEVVAALPHHEVGLVEPAVARVVVLGLDAPRDAHLGGLKIPAAGAAQLGLHVVAADIVDLGRWCEVSPGGVVGRLGLLHVAAHGHVPPGRRRLGFHLPSRLLGSHLVLLLRPLVPGAALQRVVGARRRVVLVLFLLQPSPLLLRRNDGAVRRRNLAPRIDRLPFPSAKGSHAGGGGCRGGPGAAADGGGAGGDGASSCGGAAGRSHWHGWCLRGRWHVGILGRQVGGSHRSRGGRRLLARWGALLAGHVVLLVGPLHDAELAADLLHGRRADPEGTARLPEGHVKLLGEDVVGHHDGVVGGGALVLPRLAAREDDGRAAPPVRRAVAPPPGCVV